MKIWFLLLFVLFNWQCKSSTNGINQTQLIANQPILCGADQPNKYLHLLKNKRIGLIVNQTSVTAGIHLVDFLVNQKINIKIIFSPEHGFRGDQPDGADISDTKDNATGIPIVSLYGTKKAPSKSDLSDIDILVFDIQDVGARFYTYLSTLKYAMEACAEYSVPLVILDRPNPNGQYVDGPVLDMKFSSFVGVIPIPIVHGMTLGELAMMMNGEKWLKNGMQCKLTVITCRNYSHSMYYSLPVRPSPNLPNDLAIALYPSLCLFEGTNVSVGRGTDQQFQIYGSPYLPTSGFEFVPMPNEGSAHPPFQGQVCRGIDFSELNVNTIRTRNKINLSYLLDAYKQFKDKNLFFLKNNYFDKLAGTDQLRLDIINGKNESEIRAKWENDLQKFMKMRSHYLLYSN